MMKKILYLIPLVVLSQACKKEKPAPAPAPAPAGVDLTMELGTTEKRYLAPGKTLWLEMNVEPGKIYRIAWFDSWFDPYTANSIWVTGYKTDKLHTYFNRDRLIQMSGSAKTFMADESGKFYMKIEGFDENTAGHFGVLADTLNRSAATMLTTGTEEDFEAFAGDTKLYAFDAAAGSSHIVSLFGSSDVGASGNAIHVSFDAFGGDSHTKYFSGVIPGTTTFPGGPNTQTLTADSTERIYVTLNGAYWWDMRTGYIKVD